MLNLSARHKAGDAIAGNGWRSGYHGHFPPIRAAIAQRADREVSVCEVQEAFAFSDDNSPFHFDTPVTQLIFSDMSWRVPAFRPDSTFWDILSVRSRNRYAGR